MINKNKKRLPPPPLRASALHNNNICPLATVALFQPMSLRRPEVRREDRQIAASVFDSFFYFRLFTLAFLVSTSTTWVLMIESDGKLVSSDFCFSFA